MFSDLGKSEQELCHGFTSVYKHPWDSDQARALSGVNMYTVAWTTITGQRVLGLGGAAGRAIEQWVLALRG